MKVLALNGSPRAKSSSTYHMLKPFLEGMEAGGAETEVIHLRELHIEPCIGCFTCWVRTPGVCVHKDDMAEVLEKFNQADLVIFGTPLYVFTMSGIMKDFIDRLLPRLEPWLEPHPTLSHLTMHPVRVQKPHKMFLISPAGFPEFEHFDSLVATFKHISRMTGWEYTGEILRPGAEALSHRNMHGSFSGYRDLLRRAGEQLAREGRITVDLQTELRKDLFPGGKQAFHSMANAFWNELMDRHNLPQELRHTVPMLAEDLATPLAAHEDVDVEPVGAHEGDRLPVPNDLTMDLPGDINDSNDTETAEEGAVDYDSLTFRQLIGGMPGAFKSEAAGDLVADIQFSVTGQEPGEYYLHIEGGKCSFHEGKAESPQLTINTPSEVWLAISRGKLDGQQAFMQQKYTASGDFGLLMKLSKLFTTT